jgi:predicted DCC family thiol-disulfide oxidoreductase YuxK
MHPTSEQAMNPPIQPGSAHDGTSLAYPITIYFDASCPLCTSEMGALKAHDGAERLRLVDCAAAGFDDADVRQAGFSPAELLRIIHARDASGRWLRGVEVFEAAYRAVGLRTLAFLWGCRLWRPLLDRLYPVIARNRRVLSRLGLPAAVRAGLGALGNTGGVCDARHCARR